MGRRSKSTISKRSNPPPPSSSNHSNGSTVLGNIFTGITFGAGSSLGHRAVDGVMGNREVDIKQPEIKNDTGIPCGKLFEVYKICIEDNNNCKFWEDVIKLKCS